MLILGILCLVALLTLGAELALLQHLRSDAREALATAERSRRALAALGPAGMEAGAVKERFRTSMQGLPKAEEEGPDALELAARALELERRISRSGGSPARAAEAAALLRAEPELLMYCERLASPRWLELASVSRRQGGAWAVRIECEADKLDQLLALLAAREAMPNMEGMEFTRVNEGSLSLLLELRPSLGRGIAGL